MKYTGKQIKEMMADYNPIFGGDSLSKNKKINSDSNKESIKNTEVKIAKAEKEPVTFNVDQISTDTVVNKNPLNLEYGVEPSKEFKDRVEKAVTGDSKLGNAPSESAPTDGNKKFYDLVKKASDKFIDDKHTLQSTGLVSKNIDIPKRPTAFESYKRLNFKNTVFLGKDHMLSLIPEEFKKAGNCFVMKDKMNDEYLIEWVVDEKTNLSEGVIREKQNKLKLNEEFDKIKKLYSYNSKNHFTNARNINTQKEEKIFVENINKLKEKQDL